MNLNEYQRRAHSTAVYPEEFGIIYPALKLAGEAGEVVEKVGKAIRDGSISMAEVPSIAAPHVVNNMTQEQVDAILKEVGDTLWYAAEVTTVLGYTLDQVARRNLDKLADRSIRGLLVGDGDDR